MLNKSRINPKLSTHDQLFGTFNYSRTPLAPLGTKSAMHERPTETRPTLSGTYHRRRWHPRVRHHLVESGKLANSQLQKVLADAGYYPSHFTCGLYTHKRRDTAFSLVVHDFSVRFTRKADAEYLERTIRNAYPVKTD